MAIESDSGAFRVGPMLVSPFFGRSNLKFTPRRSMTTFCGQPSGPTIVPAAVFGHLSLQSLTPSWSLSIVEQSAGGGAAAGGGGGAAWPILMTKPTVARPSTQDDWPRVRPNCSSPGVLVNPARREDVVSR